MKLSLSKSVSAIIILAFVLQSTNAFALRTPAAGKTPLPGEIKGAMHETAVDPIIAKVAKEYHLTAGSQKTLQNELKRLESLAKDPSIDDFARARAGNDLLAFEDDTIAYIALKVERLKMEIEDIVQKADQKPWQDGDKSDPLAYDHVQGKLAQIAKFEFVLDQALAPKRVEISGAMHEEIKGRQAASGNYKEAADVVTWYLNRYFDDHIDVRVVEMSPENLVKQAILIYNLENGKKKEFDIDVKKLVDIINDSPESKVQITWEGKSVWHVVRKPADQARKKAPKVQIVGAMHEEKPGVVQKFFADVFAGKKKADQLIVLPDVIKKVRPSVIYAKGAGKVQVALTQMGFTKVFVVVRHRRANHNISSVLDDTTKITFSTSRTFSDIGNEDWYGEGYAEIGFPRFTRTPVQIFAKNANGDMCIVEHAIRDLDDFESADPEQKGATWKWEVRVFSNNSVDLAGMRRLAGLIKKIDPSNDKSIVKKGAISGAMHEEAGWFTKRGAAKHDEYINDLLGELKKLGVPERTVLAEFSKAQKSSGGRLNLTYWLEKRIREEKKSAKPSSSTKIAGAMHDSTPRDQFLKNIKGGQDPTKLKEIDRRVLRIIQGRDMARGVIGAQTPDDNNGKNLVLVYSPKASADPEVFKLILDAAGVLLKTRPDTHIIFTYDGYTQKEQLDMMMSRAGEKVQDMIDIEYIPNARKAMAEYVMGGYTVRYTRTGNPADMPVKLNGVEDKMLPALNKYIISEEFEQEFKQEVANLTKA